VSAAEELERARRAYAGGQPQRDPGEASRNDGLTRAGANGSAGAGGSR
jgi:hypothetical protein